MAQSYCSGPVSLFCGVGPSDAAMFLGHFEAGCRIVNRFEYDAVMNDLAGNKLPLDEQQMGAEALITGIGPLTRWNETTFALIEARQMGGTRGIEPFGTLGAFMIGEKISYQLWLRFPYAAKASMNLAASGAMEAGRHYLSAKLVDDDAETGTRHKRQSLSFQCRSVYNFTTGSMTLFDYNGLASLTIN